ncbi:MAG: hypothetical protein V9E87_15760 [Gemmatimonadales bacterium]
MSTGRETAEVRDGGAGDERPGGVGRKAEQLRQPPERHPLDDRRPWRGAVEAGVLVPRRRQPVGRHADRQRATDHEAEEARAGHRHRGRRDHLIEPGEDIGRCASRHRHRLIEFHQAGHCRGIRGDGPGIEPVEVSRRAGRRIKEEAVRVVVELRGCGHGLGQLG